jgi:drug/metabolite transporter (DMT)-like permease
LALAVFLMVFASASLHVLWNALVKRCADKVSFAWLTSVVGTLAVLPVFVGSRLLAPGPLDGRIVGLALVSGLIEASYIVALFLAYEHADLSVAYPLSRGVAPLAGMAPGIVLLGDRLSLWQGLGVLLIVAGAAAVAGSALTRGGARAAARRGVALALLTGCLIAGYHLVDRGAMRLTPSPAVVEYFFLMHVTLLAALTLWVLTRAAYRRRLWSEWHGNRTAVLAVGVMSVAAYMLIMVALRYGNVTLVAATRNIGIAVSIAVGALFLKEQVCLLRGSGAALIIGGVLVLLLSPPAPTATAPGSPAPAGPQIPAVEARR